MPEPKVDEGVERAPGGADAELSESDVGAASEGEPLTPDPPLSAQKGEDDIPDALQEPESPEPEAKESEDATSEPSA